jgi:hypothetical protein
MSEGGGQFGSAEAHELQLTIQGSDVETLLALRDWLAAEDVMRGRLQFRRRPVAAGQMGGALDMLVVALGSGGAGAVLAESLSTWLSQRRTDVIVTVSSRGRELTLDVKRARDPQTVIREMHSLLEAVEE